MSKARQIGVRVEDELLQRLKREVARRSRLAGVDLKDSMVVRALLSERLDQIEAKEHETEK